MLKTTAQFVKNFWGDGNRWLRALAPIASLTWVGCKFWGVAVNLQDYSYAWALLPIIIWLFVAYVSRWRKSCEFEDQLNSTAHLNRDVYLIDAMWRIALGRWGVSEHWEAAGEKLVNAMEHGRFEALQAACDDKLIIWGKSRDFEFHKKIPPAFWDDNTININECSKDNSIDVATEPSGYFNEMAYKHLMTSRHQVDKLWPAANT